VFKLLLFAFLTAITEEVSFYPNFSMSTT